MAIIRFPVRLFGLLLIAAALVLLADDVVAINWNGLSGFAPDPLGALIYATMPEGLNASQAFIQRYVSPFLWDPIIQTILTWWDWAAIGGLGLILALVARRPRVKLDPARVETAG